MSTQDKLVEIRKLASRLQSASYDHGSIDSSDRWSYKKYAWANDRSNAALAALTDAVSEALQANTADADVGERIAELQASADLRWKADMRAIERWRAAHPDKELVWPDHADLCVWLMGELDALDAMVDKRYDSD